MAEGLTNERAENAHDTAETRGIGIRPDQHFANPTSTAEMGALLKIDDFSTLTTLKVVRGAVFPARQPSSPVAAQDLAQFSKPGTWPQSTTNTLQTA